MTRIKQILALLIISIFFIVSCGPSNEEKTDYFHLLDSYKNIYEEMSVVIEKAKSEMQNTYKSNGYQTVSLVTDHPGTYQSLTDTWEDMIKIRDTIKDNKLYDDERSIVPIDEVTQNAYLAIIGGLTNGDDFDDVYYFQNTYEKNLQRLSNSVTFAENNIKN